MLTLQRIRNGEINPRQVRVLNLNNRNLTEIPTEVFQCFNLERLHLSNNRIREIPPQIKELRYLSHLSLHYNQLRTLPPEIGDLPHLETLMLRGNQLRQLPTEIGKLICMTQLNIAENQLTGLPDSLCHLYLDSLVIFVCDSNRFQELPIHIWKMDEFGGISRHYPKLVAEAIDRWRGSGIKRIKSSIKRLRS